MWKKMYGKRRHFNSWKKDITKKNILVHHTGDWIYNIHWILIFVDFVGTGESQIKMFNESQIFERNVCRLFTKLNIHEYASFHWSTKLVPTKIDESTVVLEIFKSVMNLTYLQYLNICYSHKPSYHHGLYMIPITNIILIKAVHVLQPYHI